MKLLKHLIFLLIFLLNIKNVNAESYILINNNTYENIEENLKENKSITINLDYKSDELIVKRKVLDLIKNKNKTITYNILNNDEIIYSYIFNGKYFNKSYNDINLKILFSSNKDNYINEIFNDKNKIIFNTVYDGLYPEGTILSIKNITKLKKQNLYSIDEDNNIHKINSSNIIKNNNFIDININKGDTYIITNKTLINFQTIKMYLSINIIFIIEIVIFMFIAFYKRIEIPKLKSLK